MPITTTMAKQARATTTFPSYSNVATITNVQLPNNNENGNNNNPSPLAIFSLIHSVRNNNPDKYASLIYHNTK
jgi:hypothetical protein